MKIEIIVRGPPKSGKTRLVKGLHEMLIVSRMWGDIAPGTKVEILEETTPKEAL